MISQENLQKFLTPKRRVILGRLWMVGVVLYASLRAYVISHSMSKYGINGKWYFLFEMAIAIPYSYCSLRLVLSIVDRRKMGIYLFGLFTAILFFAPDIYVLTFADSPPLHVYTFYLVFLTLTTTVSSVGIWKESRRRKEVEATLKSHLEIA